jgi:hypothetical protein
VYKNLLERVKVKVLKFNQDFINKKEIAKETDLAVIKILFILKENLTQLLGMTANE